MSERPCRLFVVMGVSGCGKSSIGKALVDRIGGTYIEGDALHPEANIKRMSAGIPLTDEDRWPWLKMIAQTMASHTGLVFAGCSALRKSYRTFLADNANEPVSFIHLSGSKDLVAERMNSRTGHFMPPQLLDSQFAALEVPDISERALTVDISGTQDEIVDTILNELKNREMLADTTFQTTR